MVAQPGVDFGLKPVSLGPEGGILRSPGRSGRSELPGGLPCGHNVRLPTGQAGVWVLSKALSWWPSWDETGPGSHSYGHTVGNSVWGQVVIWQLLILVALSNHTDYGVEVLAESGHGLPYRFLDEMLLWVHAQEQLKARTQTDIHTDRLICNEAMLTDRPCPTRRDDPLGVNLCCLVRVP